MGTGLYGLLAYCHEAPVCQAEVDVLLCTLLIRRGGRGRLITFLWLLLRPGGEFQCDLK